jgi:hypothetical protein
MKYKTGDKVCVKRVVNQFGWSYFNKEAWKKITSNIVTITEISKHEMPYYKFKELGDTKWPEDIIEGPLYTNRSRTTNTL